MLWTGHRSRQRKQNVWRPGGVKSKDFDVAKGGAQVCIEEKTVRDDKGKTGGAQIKGALAIHASEFAFRPVENGELQTC